MALDRSYLPSEHTDKHGRLAYQCDICGFTYFDDELTMRNGSIVCTVAGTKSAPCFDERGYRERVHVKPFHRRRPEDRGGHLNRYDY